MPQWKGIEGNGIHKKVGKEGKLIVKGMEI